MTGKPEKDERPAMERVYRFVCALPTEREQNLAALAISALGYKKKAARRQRKQTPKPERRDEDE